jgi:hypothetical protein
MGLFGKLFNIADHVATLPLEVLRDAVDPRLDGHNTAKRVHRLIDEVDGTADERERRRR